MLLNAVVVGLIAVFARIDSRMLGRLNFERPLITCTLVGLFLGDVKTGILHKCKIQSRNVRQINGLHFGFLLF